MQDETLRDQKLSELDDWQLQDSDQDVRGREIFTAAGARLGTIRDMMVDTQRERVSAVVLDDGRTLPVESLELRPDEVIAHDAAPGPSARVYHAVLIRRSSDRRR